MRRAFILGLWLAAASNACHLVNDLDGVDFTPDDPNACGDCPDGVCADGVCCDRACDGVCEGCNIAGSEGVCTQQPSGATTAACEPGVCDRDGNCLTGAHIWSRAFGGPGMQSLQRVGVDHAGAVYLTGPNHGTLDFGFGAMVADGQDGYLAKLGPNGEPQWSLPMVGMGDDIGQHVLFGDSNDVVWVGTAWGSLIDIGGGPIWCGPFANVVLAKYGDGGEHHWSKCFGGDGHNWIGAASVDGTGDIYLTGLFGGSFDFGGGPHTAVTVKDMFLAKLTPEGEHDWSRAFGIGYAIDSNAIGVNAGTTVFVAGNFEGFASFGGETHSAPGESSGFVARYHASSGIYQNSISFGDELVNVRHLAVVGDGIVLVGYFSGSLDFGNGALVAEGSEDMFVALLGGDAIQPVWSKRFGDGVDGQQRAMRVAVDSVGNILVSGYYQGSVDFGGAPLPAPVFPEIHGFVVKLDAQGNHLWSKGVGDAGSAGVSSVRLTPTDEVVVGGVFGKTLDVGGGPLTAVDASIYVAKFAP